MCRLLLIKSPQAQAVQDDLAAFAELCRTSPEYQGHGWGLAYKDHADQWRHYRSLTPVWEDDFSFVPRTRWLLVHARSAFQNEGITVENNMPFTRGDSQFIFNGELRGVRLRVPGRIGAEKLFNTVSILHRGNLGRGVKRAVATVLERSRYVRAMNMILTEGEQALVFSYFGEAADYFTLYRRDEGGCTRVCSGRYGNPQAWRPLENLSLEVIE